MWLFAALWEIPAHVFGDFLMPVDPVNVPPYGTYQVVTPELFLKFDLVCSFSLSRKKLVRNFQLEHLMLGFIKTRLLQKLCMQWHLERQQRFLLKSLT